MVLHHHERYDGNGYPHGLAGRDIPLESRIIAVADAYSAMISQRPYGPPLPTIVAEAELEFRKGTQFDPEVVDYFLELLREHGEGYRLGMKADFRMEVQDVRFLRELPVEPEPSRCMPSGAGDQERVQQGPWPRRRAGRSGSATARSGCRRRRRCRGQRTRPRGGGPTAGPRTRRRVRARATSDTAGRSARAAGHCYAGGPCG